MLKWALVIVVGVVALSLLSPRLTRYGLGRLPGDLTLRWRGRPVYVPITTTLLVSALLTLLGRLI